ncbi:MAG: ParA family protein [Firmicutes bacterium]|nr:ParA family protein [Bacillota bacterium]
MNQVICISNSKGGVGKTTTALNLSAGLTLLGAKVLAIDADPQADLTAHMGWTRSDELEITLNTKLKDVLMENGDDPLSGILHHPEGIDLLPSNLELSSMEMNLVNAMSRETVLRSYVSEVRDMYDFIVIDCQPSLGMVSLNALTSADSVIIPVQAQYLPAKGMTDLLNTIQKVGRHLNPTISIEGILITLVDNRTNLAKNTIQTIQDTFGDRLRIFPDTIPIAVKVAEASAKGQSIFSYDASCPAAKAYMNLAEEVVRDAEREQARNQARSSFIGKQLLLSIYGMY